MRKLFLIFLLLAIIVVPVQARDNSLEEGKKALQFGVNDNFTLSSFQGSVLSLKKHTSDGSAWRLGLSLTLDLGDNDYSWWENDSLVIDNGDNDIQKVGFDLQRIFYPNPDNDINLYYGLGPTLTYDYRKSKSFSSSSSVLSQTRTDRSWRVGGKIILGVEWFAGKSISLNAEYGTSLLYRYRKYTTEILYASGTVRGSESKSNTFQLAPSSVRLGLSAYF